MNKSTDTKNVVVAGCVVVGPMTITMLMLNTLKTAQLSVYP
jgi:5,10-methylene-tetrahydrofolate dehydrogenase/methenyl tetrahydrofolate cyclohydrolase